MWGFFNGSTDDYACGGFPNQPVVPYGPDEDGLYINNEIWSPPIDWTRDTTGTPIPSDASGVMLEYDAYGDMGTVSGVLGRWGIRSKVAGCWGTWQSVASWFPEKQWYRFRQEITGYIDPGADTIQVALGCFEPCPVYCEPEDCHSHGPLYDNVRVIRFKPPVCQVTPDSLDFGAVAVGDSLDKMFTITNTSTSGILSGTVHETCSDYSIVSEAYYSLAGGQSQDFTVRFKPTAIGSHICTVETWDDLCSDVACSGDGVGTLYVDAEATGLGDGSSWLDAYTELRDALATADSTVSEIWVAAGTYTPTASTDRSATFQLRDSLAVYGGFAGTETTLAERDWAANVTILSGDLGIVDNDSDNSYHVVTASGTDSSAVLDGFTVTEGNANGGGEDGRGGGIYNAGGSPIVQNVWIYGHRSVAGGSAMYNTGANPIIQNTIVYDRILNVNGSVPVITNSSIVLSKLINNDSSPLIYNTILWTPRAEPVVENTGTSSPSFRNSLVVGSGGSSSWDSGFGTDLGNNIDDDPMFKGVTVGDLHLWSSSPAIEAGDNSAPNLPVTDLDGNPRIYGTNVDMGAYEYQGPATGIEDDPAPTLPKTFALHQNVPNPFNPTTIISYDVPVAGGKVALQVYDVAGRLVRTLVDGLETPGEKRVTWNGLNSQGNRVATGVYFYRMTAAGFTKTRKMVLLQ
jgi:hypothetical protein